MPELLQDIAEVAVGVGVMRHPIDRALDELEGDFRLPLLVGQQAHEMERVGLLGIRGEHPRVGLLGLVEPTCLVELDASLHLFARGHESTSSRMAGGQPPL